MFNVHYRVRQNRGVLIYFTQENDLVSSAIHLAGKTSVFFFYTRSHALRSQSLYYKWTRSAGCAQLILWFELLPPHARTEPPKVGGAAMQVQKVGGAEDGSRASSRELPKHLGPSVNPQRPFGLPILVKHTSFRFLPLLYKSLGARLPGHCKKYVH